MRVCVFDKKADLWITFFGNSGDIILICGKTLHKYQKKYGQSGTFV